MVRSCVTPHHRPVPPARPLIDPLISASLAINLAHDWGTETLFFWAADSCELQEGVGLPTHWGIEPEPQVQIIHPLTDWSAVSSAREEYLCLRGPKHPQT